MLTTFTNSILPVFAILAIGFIMGRTAWVSGDEARGANRIAFLTMQPALIFSLMVGIDMQAFDFSALAIYTLAEIITFTIGYLIARKVFGRDLREAILLGMALIFVNSLLYIWPISFLIYGEAAALPITAIVALDSSITFGAFIIAMEVTSGGSGGTRAALGAMARNPVLMAIVIGAALNLANVPVPEPILTFADFVGRAAAPLTLFVLGVILSQSPLMPGAIDSTFIAIKLVGFPLLVWLGMTILSPGHAWLELFLVCAAGPSGAMAFALALMYGVRSDVIARVIIWTSALSLISLAYLA